MNDNRSAIDESNLLVLLPLLLLLLQLPQQQLRVVLHTAPARSHDTHHIVTHITHVHV